MPVVVAAAGTGRLLAVAQGGGPTFRKTATGTTIIILTRLTETIHCGVGRLQNRLTEPSCCFINEVFAAA